MKLLGSLLALYLAAPLVAAAAHLGEADWRGADWPALGRATLVSLASATVATALVTLLGVPLAYGLARGRRTALLGMLVQLPLALPPLASGILLLFLLGYASPLGALTHGALTDSFAGIVLAEAFVSAPFLIIAARSAFAAADPALEGVAATLGLSPGRVFRRVSLPLAARAIVAGMLLTWLRAFGEFGATVMVSYHPYSLPVYTYVAFGSQGLPAMLPVLLPTLAAAVAAVAFATWLAGDSRARPIRATPIDEPPPQPAPTLPPAPGQPIRFAIRQTLDGFTLDIAWSTTARRLAILGASGSGKSMTLRSLAGLGPPGTLVLGDTDLSALPPERRAIAYVPQGYGLFPHLTVSRQLQLAPDHDPTLAHAWVERLGLAGLEQRRPAALSLGQQQRVALARALSRPASRLMLLDEPFSSLDAPLRHRLRRLLLSLQQQLSTTTILVTHDPEEAFLLADEVLVIADGQVLQSGPVEAVFRRPASAHVAQLLGAQTLATGTATGPATIEIGAGITITIAGPPLQPGTRLGWSIAPDAVRLVATGGHPAILTALRHLPTGRREASLRLGDADLTGIVDPDCDAAIGDCRITLQPGAMQVWPEG